MGALCQASEKGSRIEQLVELRNRLASAIDNCESMRDLASLAKQYRETIKEIEEIEGGNNGGDELGAILERRQADGKPGAVRANRS